jgi:hypothetical protein
MKAHAAKATTACPERLSHNRFPSFSTPLPIDLAASPAVLRPSTHAHTPYD